MLDYQLSGGELSLSGQLRVQFLDIFKEGLSQAASQGRATRVDLSQVREADLAGLQLLLAWLRSDAGPGTRLQGLPRSLERAIGLSGLKEHLAPYME